MTNIRFNRYAFPGRCNVCGKDCNVIALRSEFTETSITYCKDCFNAGKEPYFALTAYVAAHGLWPNVIDKAEQAGIRKNLVYLNKSEDEFAADVLALRKKMGKCV